MELIVQARGASVWQLGCGLCPLIRQCRCVQQKQGFVCTCQSCVIFLNNNKWERAAIH